MRLERSEAADRDLDEILGYSVIQFGETVAAEYFFSFDEAFALLERHPRAGNPAPEAGSRVRRLKHRSHRIFYEIERDRVLVLRVLHHALDVTDLLDE